MDFQTENWQPESHDTFREAVGEGRVELNFLPEHYEWARAQIGNTNIIPRSNTKLRRDVLDRMAFYEDFYLKARSQNIDLMLRA